MKRRELFKKAGMGSTALAPLLTLAVIVFASVLILGAGPKRHTGEGCTEASLQGTYGFATSGTRVGVGPLTVVGILTFDGAGNVSGHSKGSANGELGSGTLTGTYKVNSDCTSSVTLTSEGGAEDHLELVIVNAGSEYLFIKYDPGAVVTGVGKKQ